VNDPNYQIIYSDTPGIVEPAYKMHEGMMKFVRTSLEDADLLLLIIECGQKELKDENLLKQLTNLEVPLMVLINKIDLNDQKAMEESLTHWAEVFPKANIIPISALHGFNIDLIKEKVLESIPIHPPYYPKEGFTDKSERFIVEEKIREKILLNYKKEIPYSVEIKVDTFKEEAEIIKIRVLIIVERDSQKHILIGKGGNALKRIGTQARIDLEDFFEKKIFLELFVKVNKDWRNDEQQLKRFGYL
jgi:GTP-binding protein Era